MDSVLFFSSKSLPSFCTGVLHFTIAQLLFLMDFYFPCRHRNTRKFEAKWLERSMYIKILSYLHCLPNKRRVMFLCVTVSGYIQKRSTMLPRVIYS